MEKETNNKEFFIGRLKECIENVAGFSMRTPRDFTLLASIIFNETKNQVSPTTLKRLWGYLQEKEQQASRTSTLNILSIYIGYPDYDTFCKYQQVAGECDSNFLLNNCLQTRSLLKGDKVRLMWQPDRCITIEYIGLCMFKVLESKNSKLSKGDTFICERFVENSPLMLSNLIHDNSNPVNYICGKRNGIKYQLITKA